VVVQRACWATTFLLETYYKSYLQTSSSEKNATYFDKKSIPQVKREAKKALRDKHFPSQAELQSMLASISPADLGDSPD
jgi:hypothetical protein